MGLDHGSDGGNDDEEQNGNNEGKTREEINKDLKEGMEETFGDPGSDKFKEVIGIDEDSEYSELDLSGVDIETSTNQEEKNGAKYSEDAGLDEDDDDDEADEPDDETITVKDERTDFGENPFEGVSLRPGEEYQAHPDEFKDVDEIDSFEFPDKIKVDSGYISEDSNLGEKDRMRVFIDHSNELMILMFESHRESHFINEEMDEGHELLDESDESPGVMVVTCDYSLAIWQLTFSGTKSIINDLPEENEADKKLTNEMYAPPEVELFEVPKQWWSNSNQRKAVQKCLGSLVNAFSPRAKEWRHLTSYLNRDKIDLYMNSIEDDGTPVELLQSVESIRQINVGGESEIKIEIDSFDGFHRSTETIDLDADDFHATSGTTDPEINSVLSHFGGGTGIGWNSWKLMKEFLSDIVEVETVKSEEPEKVKASAVTAEIRKNSSLVADEKAFSLTQEHAFVSKHEGKPVAFVKSSVMQQAAQSARISISELSKELQAESRLTGPTCQKRIDGTVFRVWPFQVDELAKSVDDIAGIEQSDIDEQDLVEEGVNPSGEGSGDTSGDGSGSGDTIDPYGGE